MKNSVKAALVAVMLACAAIPAALIWTIPIGGTGCALIQPGNSTLVVRAEQTAKISFDVTDAVLLYEKTNRDALFKLSPDIKKSADVLRVEVPKALDALRLATKTYKANRTPENQATLATWLSVVDALTIRAGELMAKAKGIQ